jgi:hypothetical protein
MDKLKLEIFKERLRTNYIRLISETQDPDMICNYLYGDGVLSKHMVEEVCYAQTPTKKNSKLYDLLPTRGSKVYTSTYNALRKTGNQELAEILMEGLCETGIKTPPPVSLNLPPIKKKVIFFEPLTEAVSKMRPLETPSVRGNNVAYKTAIDIYPDDLPKTQVGMNELPFVAALALGYSKDTVTGWKYCPAVLALDAAYEIYISEINTVENFLLALDGGGMEMLTNTAALGIVSVMQMLKQPAWVQMTKFKICEFSETNKRRLAVHLHAIVIGSPLSFILRKDWDAKPPAYLCYGAAQQCKRTPIILRETDRSLIDGILQQDETNHDTSLNSKTSCPFTWGETWPTAPAPWM